jgi:hypothetical protein
MAQSGLENYTFLTLTGERFETNVYAGPRSSILRGFSNKLMESSKLCYLGVDPLLETVPSPTLTALDLRVYTRMRVPNVR